MNILSYVNSSALIVTVPYTLRPCKHGNIHSRKRMCVLRLCVLISTYECCVSLFLHICEYTIKNTYKSQTYLNVVLVSLVKFAPYIPSSFLSLIPTSISLKYKSSHDAVQRSA